MSRCRISFPFGRAWRSSVCVALDHGFENCRACHRLQYTILAAIAAAAASTLAGAGARVGAAAKQGRYTVVPTPDVAAHRREINTSSA